MWGHDDDEGRHDGDEVGMVIKVRNFAEMGRVGDGDIILSPCCFLT